MTRALVNIVLVTFAVLAISVLWGWVGGSANAAAPVPARSHADVQLEVGHSPLTVLSTKAVPAKYRVIAEVSFNGHPAQMEWADSRYAVEFAWHGVIVSVEAAKRRAPFVVRAASVRRDTVHVFVRLSWRSA